MYECTCSHRRFQHVGILLLVLGMLVLGFQVLLTGCMSSDCKANGWSYVALVSLSYLWRALPSARDTLQYWGENEK